MWLWVIGDGVPSRVALLSRVSDILNRASLLRAGSTFGSCDAGTSPLRFSAQNPCWNVIAKRLAAAGCHVVATDGSTDTLQFAVPDCTARKKDESRSRTGYYFAMLL